MPTFSDLSIKDGQATPVNRTFKARRSSNGVFTWFREDSSPIPLGYPSLTITQKPPKSADGITMTELRCRIPLVDAPATGVGFTPAPRLAYHHEAKVTIYTNGRGTRIDKADLLAYIASALESATMKALVADNDSIRG